VLVQAFAIEHPAIRFAARHDFEGFAEVELASRALLGNPPYGYLALVRVQGLEQPRVAARARALAGFLRSGVAKLREEQPAQEGELPVAELLGPSESPIARINRKSRWQLLLRTRKRAPLRWLLTHLRSRLGARGSGAAQTTAIVDVDPQSLL
jgi:primosomal protein N' (replication factor Y)